MKCLILALDNQATDELLKILKSLGADTNFFIISHKGDVLLDKFERTISFEKVNGFSKAFSEGLPVGRAPALQAGCQEFESLKTPSESDARYVCLTSRFTLAMVNTTDTMISKKKSKHVGRNSVATSHVSMELDGQAYIPTGNSTKNTLTSRSFYFLNKNYSIQNLRLRTVGLMSIQKVVTKCA